LPAVRFGALLFVLVCAVAVAPLPAPAAPVPKHLIPKAEEPPFCFPTRVGDRFVSVIGERELVVVVTKVQKTEEGFEVTQEYEDGMGGRNHDMTVIASAKGLKVVRYAGRQLDEPLWWLKLPHVANNEWTDTWAGQTRTHRTMGWEEIEVPAGKIRAIRVERDDGPQAMRTTTYWYAPGLGCIKWSSGNGGRELKSFTPGK
jgi:hypothetical protein